MPLTGLRIIAYRYVIIMTSLRLKTFLINKNMLPYYARKVVQYLSFSLFLYLLLFVDPSRKGILGRMYFFA